MRTREISLYEIDADYNCGLIEYKYANRRALGW